VSKHDPSTRRARVGVDFHQWDGIFQGTRSHILGLYREAIKLAPDFDFWFFLEGTESLRAACPEFSAPHVRLVPMPSRPALWRMTMQWPLLQWRHRLDILHLQYRLPLIPAGDSAITIHDLLFETHPQYYQKWYVKDARYSFRRAARKAPVVFTVSEFCKRDIVARYSVPSGRIHVTANGVDPGRFYPAARPEPALGKFGLSHQGYLLTVGRLEPRKNHETLIQAYAQLPSDAPPLIIAGQADFGYDPIFKRIRDAGLENRVQVLQDVSDEFLPMVMRHARLFVFPSFAEGFGLPVLEAMASGVPVITSNTTALPEVAGNAALYAPPDDSAEIARLIQRALSDQDLSGQMSRQGLQQAKKFGWPSAAAVMIDAYRRRFAEVGLK
jgi:glycosyltransferase involved in cell wall biosynthesis